MQWGICGGADRAEAARAAGFDYVEGNVQRQLLAEAGDDMFRAELEKMRGACLPIPVLNGFVPGHLKITGPEADMELLRAYVSTALSRAEEAGIEYIVFGSGGARQIPDGFDRDEAWQQLVAFGRMAATFAREHHVVLVTEPLRVQECNVLTTVAESARYVRDVNDPSMMLLVDIYHWLVSDNDLEAIVEAGSLIRHAHIATIPNRLAPGMEDCDFGPVFDALKRSGYDGRVSIEGRMPEEPDGLKKAREILAAFG